MLFFRVIYDYVQQLQCFNDLTILILLLEFGQQDQDLFKKVENIWEVIVFGIEYLQEKL